MYKIGEFGELANLSVRTLRYYNDLGLLKPEAVDKYSNYRYYSDENLKQANTINNLKMAGFTLEEIRDNWNNFTDEIFDTKKQEIYAKIFYLEEQLKQVDRLREKIPKKEKAKTYTYHI